MNKLNQLIIIIIVLSIIPCELYTQTPYDSYAPSCTNIAMLKLPEIQHRTYNPDTLSKVHYVELNSKSGTLAYYDKQENLLFQTTLNPLEQKWWTKDPLTQKFPGMSPYNAFANNPIRFFDPDGQGPLDRIKYARSFIGTTYSQESQRSNWDENSLKSVDCSELVGRVMFLDGITEKTQYFTTSSLSTELNNSEKYEKSMDLPKPGDIILWRDDGGGHTAIITEVNNEKKTYKFVHAVGKDKGTQESKEVSWKKGSSHEFQGFFRPKIETKDWVPDDKQVQGPIIGPQYYNKLKQENETKKHEAKKNENNTEEGSSTK